MKSNKDLGRPSFKEQAAYLEDQLVAWRRDFHQHPEIGFQETRTSEIVAKTLQDLGLQVETGIAETGVVGVLEGAQTEPVVLLRFDMDALPIHEETGVPYASTAPGVMHACGHDGHTAIGLGVAHLLSRFRDRLPGVVKFVFQPAEEGLGGAERMLEAGVLERPRPDFALALHLWNVKPVGWFGVASGPMMAASDILEMGIEGQGGHGASPHQTIDPVVACAHIIAALQSIVARDLDPQDAAVVSITQIDAGDTHNVIPTRATMRGTIRTFDPEVRERVHKRIKVIAEGVAQAMKCEASVSITPLTPPVVNDVEIAARVREWIRTLYPEADVDDEACTMGSEDMSFFMRDVPGCYFFVGSNNPEKGLDAPHHSPMFDFDESVLPKAAGLMALCAWSLLHET
jgi:amidohydrolase